MNKKVYNVESDLNETQRMKKRKDHEKKKCAVQNGFDILYIWGSDVRNKDFSSIKKVIEND